MIIKIQFKKYHGILFHSLSLSYQATTERGSGLLIQDLHLDIKFGYILLQGGIFINTRNLTSMCVLKHQFKKLKITKQLSLKSPDILPMSDLTVNM